MTLKCLPALNDGRYKIFGYNRNLKIYRGSLVVIRAERVKGLYVLQSENSRGCFNYLFTYEHDNLENERVS